MARSSRGPETGRDAYDAVVVGSGPNGLSAAICLARAGQKVLLIEAKSTVGGGMRTQSLTLPGFRHDVCSAIHPMVPPSQFMRSVPLAEHGLTWLESPLALAHPLLDQDAAILTRSVGDTALSLGADGPAYERLMTPFVPNASALVADLAGPLRIPKLPILAARFGLQAMRSATGLARHHFRTERAHALIAGLAVHSVLPLEKPASAAITLMLGVVGHAFGWPFPAGGAQSIADALASYFTSMGGEIRLDCPVQQFADLPAARRVFFDLTPRQILAIDGLDLRPGLRRRLARYRYGPGVFKLDWALKEPIPWRDPACRQAATVHVGGTLAEIASAERDAWEGRLSSSPFVLLTQPSLFDSTRAPASKHTAWGYCHVPHAAQLDVATMTDILERQIERFAPGFRDCILARHAMTPADFTAYNANYVGGDIVAGVADLGQIFTRPVARINPYALAGKHFYICSAATPPGAGVHGLGGYFAVRSALRP